MENMSLVILISRKTRICVHTYTYIYIYIFVYIFNIYLTIRLRARYFYEVIVNEGKTRVNYRFIEIESE